MSQSPNREPRETTDSARRGDDAEVGRVPFETPPSSTDEDPGDADFPIEAAEDRRRPS